MSVPLRRLALLAPVVFAVHVLEEAPRFVGWFNSLVPRGITQPLFLTVNAVAFAITILVAIVVAAAPSEGSALLLSAWVGFLMLANGLFHLVGTIVHGCYSPGVVTGTLIYLPYSILVLHRAARELDLEPGAVAAAAAIGAAPMLVHGYLIVFRASRLF